MILRKNTKGEFDEKNKDMVNKKLDGYSFPISKEESIGLTPVKNKLMQKLIKLSDTHYIVVDDSEIKDGDYVLLDNGKIEVWKYQVYRHYHDLVVFKITHSFGVNLKGVINKPISEVEELIYGHSVVKLAELTKEIKIMESLQNLHLDRIDKAIEMESDFGIPHRHCLNISKEMAELTKEIAIKFHRYHRMTATLSFDSTGENHGKPIEEIFNEFLKHEIN
jgi:hypothetical protein